MAQRVTIFLSTYTYFWFQDFSRSLNILVNFRRQRRRPRAVIVGSDDGILMTKWLDIDRLMFMEIELNPEQAVKQLADRIESWLNQRPDRSKSSLARGAGVSESCIRRVMNDGSLPTAGNILKIMKFITKFASNKEILDHSEPELKQLLTFNLPYTNFASANEHINLPEVAESALNSTVKRLIFIKVGALGTLSASEIQNEFGLLGMTEAKQMVADSLLLLTGEVYAISEKFRNYAVSAQFSKKLVIETVEHYFKADTDTNYSFNVTDGVSTKGYNRVMDVMIEAHAKISNIIKEEPGNVPVFAQATMDTLTSQSFFNKEGDL